MSRWCLIINNSNMSTSVFGLHTTSWTNLSPKCIEVVSFLWWSYRILSFGHRFELRDGCWRDFWDGNLGSWLIRLSHALWSCSSLTLAILFSSWLSYCCTCSILLLPRCHRTQLMMGSYRQWLLSVLWSCILSLSKPVHGLGAVRKVLWFPTAGGVASLQNCGFSHWDLPEPPPCPFSCPGIFSTAGSAVSYGSSISLLPP